MGKRLHAHTDFYYILTEIIVHPCSIPTANDTKSYMQTEQQRQTTDVAVLIVFSNRTAMLRRTFEAVRKARPAHLLLYQTRPGATMYDAVRWAFSLYDKCIVLEEDSLPSTRFIPFCKELLDRYENDLRIGLIAGYNPEGLTEAPSDYLFTRALPRYGWASWRRVVQEWDGSYAVVDDPFNMHQLEALSRRVEGWDGMTELLRRHKRQGIPVCQTVMWAHMALNSCLTIMPTRNMLRIEGP